MMERSSQTLPGERRRDALFRAVGPELDESWVFGRLPSDVQAATDPECPPEPGFTHSESNQ